MSVMNDDASYIFAPASRTGHRMSKLAMGLDLKTTGVSVPSSYLVVMLIVLQGDAPADPALRSRSDLEESRDALSLRARRAQSFSDFLHAAQSQARKSDTKSKNKASEKVKTELDFQGWYQNVEEKLLDASLEEYQYVCESASEHI